MALDMSSGLDGFGPITNTDEACVTCRDVMTDVDLIGVGAVMNDVSLSGSSGKSEGCECGEEFHLSDVRWRSPSLNSR